MCVILKSSDGPFSTRRGRGSDRTESRAGLYMTASFGQQPAREAPQLPARRRVAQRPATSHDQALQRGIVAPLRQAICWDLPAWYPAYVSCSWLLTQLGNVHNA